MRPRRWSAPLLAGLLLARFSAVPVFAQQPVPGIEHEGKAFTFNQIADGIYHVLGTGSMSVGANSVIVIYEDGVLLVDDHVSPAAATVLLEELKTVTDKPLKYVVDTHFHYDHADGNQVIPASAPIIGSEFTRRMLLEGASKTSMTWVRLVAALPAQIAALKAQLDTTKAPAARTALEGRIRTQQAYQEALSAVRPVAPTITLDHRLTLHLGSREVQVLFLGRGHTGGDVVVYLPKERIVSTGDLVATAPANMIDAYVPEWVDTLDELKKLDVDIILPGHGPSFRDTAARIEAWQSYLRDFWTQVSTLKKAGATAEAAAARVDMRSHAKDYPQIQAIGANADAVARAYEILEGRVR